MGQFIDDVTSGDPGLAAALADFGGYSQANPEMKAQRRKHPLQPWKKSGKKTAAKAGPKLSPEDGKRNKDAITAKVRERVEREKPLTSEPFFDSFWEHCVPHILSPTGYFEAYPNFAAENEGLIQAMVQRTLLIFDTVVFPESREDYERCKRGIFRSATDSMFFDEWNKWSDQRIKVSDERAEKAASLSAIKCKNPSCGAQKPGLKMCSRCRNAWFCDSECQKAAWKSTNRSVIHQYRPS